MKLVTIGGYSLYLFNGICSDDKRTPDCILHLLDAGVHVVQGHGGGHDGAACVQGTGAQKQTLSEIHHFLDWRQRRSGRFY